MSAEMPWDSLWVNISAATMSSGSGAAYGAILDAAIGVHNGRITFVGPRIALPMAPQAMARRVYDGDRGWLTPGLIDCHTHLIHGGNRATEFEQRLNGISYEQIARAGGGIAATVAATRAADEDTLLAGALPRLDHLLSEGVTTIEIKSGYGLDTVTELRLLGAARRLGIQRPVEVRATFLGAHALPPEYQDDAAAYIELVCREMLPRAVEAGLVDAVDVFCEGIAFSFAQAQRVFDAAVALGLPVKIHAEQLSNLGGARLVAAYGGLSADHLEHLDAQGVVDLARAGTVAVLLPGAFYMLRETCLPPIALLRQHGVPIALATDNNPGTSPVTSLLLMLNMACTLFRLTPEEALTGITRHGARALGLADRGELRAGLRADMVLWRIDHPAELAYGLGFNPCRAVINAGMVRAPCPILASTP